MKQGALAICILILISSSCTSPKQVVYNDGMEVTVRSVATICAEVILNIEDSNVKGLGEKFEWEGKMYNAAFRSYLPCLASNTLADFPDAESGKTFKVKLYQQRQAGGECMACMATFSKAPATLYYVLPVK